MLVILVFCVILIEKIILKFNMTITNVLKYVIWQHDAGRMTLTRYMLKVRISLVCIGRQVKGILTGKM